MKVWIFPDDENRYDFSSNEKNQSIVESILNSRGFKDQKYINDFLNYNYPISDPSKFYGISDFISRLRKAVEKFQKICIFGDYDCDGITATVMLYSYLEKKGMDVMYMLPSRYEEGYGLTNDIVDKIASYKVDLIITVDNGVSAYEEIKYAQEIGIDVLVTDHHKIPDKLPPAVAIVNPHLNESEFKDFAGVGVVFKIIQEMEKDNLSVDDLLREYGDLFSIGTIGDMMPMVEENRILVKKSFEYFMFTKRPGTQVLLEGTVFGSEMDGTELSFGIVPKLNACGRMGSAEVAAKLLLSSSLDEARSFLRETIEMNESRKSLCRSIFEEVEKEILKNGLNNDRVIFAWGKNWNQGVIGIAASVICAKFGKPCFIFSIMDDEVRGSARSVPGFDIHEALSKCRHLLTKFGGHPLAAGANLKVENLEKFKYEFLKIVNSIDMPFASLNIDCVVNPRDVSLKTLDELHKISPFGNYNPEPIFCIKEAILVKFVSIGGGRHVRVFFKKGKSAFDAIMFGVASSEFLFIPGDVLDLAFRMKRNYFAGYEDAVIHLVDVKFSDIDTKIFAKEKRIFEDFMSGTTSFPENLVPKRDDFTKIFKILKENSLFCFKIERIYLMVPSQSICFSKIYLILEIFFELGVINMKKYREIYKINIKSKIKVDLRKSKILEKALRGKIWGE